MTWSALGSLLFVGAIVSLLRFGLRRVSKAPYSAPLGAATDGIAFSYLVLWMDPPASMSEGMRLAASLIVVVVVALPRTSRVDGPCRDWSSSHSR